MFTRLAMVKVRLTEIEWVDLTVSPYFGGEPMMTFDPYGIICLVPFTSYIIMPGSRSNFFAAT